MRMTGKSGGVFCESSRISVLVAVTLTDLGAHTIYEYTSHPLWDSSKPPVILVNGSAPAVAYKVDYLSGRVTFATALLDTDVVTANKFDYSVLTKVGDLYGWSLDAKLDTQDATGFEDEWHVLVSGFKSWSASVDGYHVNGYWYTAFDTGKNTYFKFYPDVGSGITGYFVGNGHFDYGVKVSKDAVITEAMPIKGTSELRLI